MLNQKGLASIEVIPVIIVFMILLNYTLGFFGIIHSGIIQSIAARNYTFETFRNRSNLKYFRDSFDLLGQNPKDGDIFGSNYRIHGIISASTNTNLIWYVATLPVRFTDLSGVDNPQDSHATHAKEVPLIQEDNKASNVTEEGVNPVWLKTVYGMCLNSTCGGI